MFTPGTPFADRYRIDAEVGRGTFGVVFRAFDFLESRSVALKVLHPEANADEKLKHRLRREARLALELKSPHSVRVLDVAETPNGLAYIVMELLEGRELRVAMSGGEPFPPERVINITRQILEAVGEAHRLGVVHRDLKPNNIFLCRTDDGSDFVKVLDFGIAKITGNPEGGGLAESARLTQQGHVLGTPVYMSPEQCNGEVPRPAGDFYSLGVVMYEMLAGRPPFDDPNPVRVMMMHNGEEVPPLPPETASTPLGVAVLRALEKFPERRYRTAQEFSEALTTIVAAPPPAPSGAPSATPAASAKQASLSEPRPPIASSTVALSASRLTGATLADRHAAELQEEPKRKMSPATIGVVIAVVLLLAAAVAAAFLS